MAESHTGAMVALVPSKADAARLAVPGGEDPDELHCTLVFLGKGIDFDDDVRARIVGSLRSLVEDAIAPDYDLPVRAEAFAVNVFNPTGEEPCLVLGVGGSDLAAVHRLVAETLRGEGSPEQHEPWVPHVTLLYAEDPAARIGDGIDRVGPVIFDRLRVAFAGDVTDIPLGVARESALAAWLEAGRLLEHLPGLHDQKDHGRRFRIPGDPASGLKHEVKKAVKGDGDAKKPGEARRRMSTVDVSTPHRAELAKRNVADLRAEAMRRQLKPGKANKARLVDMIAEHEERHGSGSVGAAVKHADHLSTTTGRPPSTNPPEVTGTNRRWWTILREDTGMDPVPIRDLELSGGYILKSGKAYRIDGITYLVEDGSTSRPASLIVEDFRAVHRLLPPEANEYQQGYAWLAGRNPADAYWEQKYDMPGFTSFATAGDGAVRIWGRAGSYFGPDSYRTEVMHEFGHNVSHAVEDQDLHDHSIRWTGAARADAGTRRPSDIKYEGLIAGRARQMNFGRRTDRPYPLGVSEYGTSSPAEDYAESVAFYLSGKLGTGRLTPGGPEVPIYFRDLFPARAALFDQVFPEIAKSQRAAISGR